ncbi:MAG TPA: LysM peptidoglycan-binding domain-containing protein [Roseiflexaceae bacterium]|nr:LysM peptidoglycan-binding domain-containing protein [Roseiflexaceae bacterium]
MRCTLAVLIPLLLAACTLPEPPTPTTPRPTAPTILEITPAPTQNIDATATSYARRLAPTPTPSGLYVVQPGDTLSQLAEAFGTTVDEIMAANGLTDPNAIQAGQTLIIPSLAPRSPAFETTPAATVQLTATLQLTVTLTPTATAALTATAVLTVTPTLSTP